MLQKIAGLKAKEFDPEEYKNLLQMLLESNRELALEAIPKLALRSVMRVAPLLASAGHLDFLVDSDGDNRVAYLADVLGLFLLLCDGASLNVNAFNADAVRADVIRADSIRADSIRADSIRADTGAEGAVYAVAAIYSAAASAFAATHDATNGAPLYSTVFDDTVPSYVTETVEAAYAADAAAAYATDVVVSYAAASISLYDALKDDLRHCESNDAVFDIGSLWNEKLPEWFSESLHKLESIVAQLPRLEGEQVEEWIKIDWGLGLLWRAAARRSATFLSTNQSHPESPSTTDNLNRQNLVNALAANLAHSANNHHRAIGLLGEWGSGKSTVLKLLKDQLKETQADQPFVFGEFNAWAYEHSDNIQAGIAQEVLNAVTTVETYEIPTKTKDEKRLTYWRRCVVAYSKNWFWLPIKAIFLRFWITFLYSMRTQKLKLLKSALVLFVALLPAALASQKIDADWFAWLGKLSSENKSLLDNVVFQLLWGAGFGLYFLKEIRSLMANPLSKELLTYIRLPDYAKHLGDIPVMRNNIKTMCNIRLGWLFGKSKRMLFIVDDLDRCRPESIVKVLEAVRLVLDLDNVIVIVAIDQHIALAALSNHFKEFSSHHKLKNSHAIAREYLSKVINLPIVLTEPNSFDVKGYMENIWADLPKVSENEQSDEFTVAAMVGVNAVGDINSAFGVPQQQYSFKENEIEPVDSQSEPNLVKVDESTKKEGTAGVQRKPNPINAMSLEKQQLFPMRKTISNAMDSLKKQQKFSPRMPNLIETLSIEKQQSFIYWVNYFKLTNPRQLKRLNNSYDLMRSYFGGFDQKSVMFSFSDKKVQQIYPMLLTLILMEYLNSLEDLAMRGSLWEKLFSNKIDKSILTNGSLTRVNPALFDEAPIDQAFIKSYRKLLQSPDCQNLAVTVEMFVLPAMV